MKTMLCHTLALLALLPACAGKTIVDGSSDSGSNGSYPVPPPHGMPSSAPPAPPAREPTTPLEALQLGVVGRWTGTATLTPGSGPLTTPSSWSLWLDLYEDGHYAAACIDATCRAAFLQGNDGDWPAKRYAIYDLAADTSSVGTGEIRILLADVEMRSEPTAWRADMKDVRLSTDRNTLSFTLEEGGALAPAVIHYELRRSPP